MNTKRLSNFYLIDNYKLNEFKFTMNILFIYMLLLYVLPKQPSFKIIPSCDIFQCDTMRDTCTDRVSPASRLVQFRSVGFITSVVRFSKSLVTLMNSVMSDYV